MLTRLCGCPATRQQCLTCCLDILREHRALQHPECRSAVPGPPLSARPATPRTPCPCPCPAEQRVPHGDLLLRLGGFSEEDRKVLAERPEAAAVLKSAVREGLAPGVAGALQDLQVSGVASWQARQPPHRHTQGSCGASLVCLAIYTAA